MTKKYYIKYEIELQKYYIVCKEFFLGFILVFTYDIRDCDIFLYNDFATVYFNTLEEAKKQVLIQKYGDKIKNQTF